MILVIKASISFTILIAFLTLVPSVEASSLYLSPASQEVARGSNFTVQVRVDTQGSDVNAVQANIQFPQDKLDLVKINEEGSGFSIKAEQKEEKGLVRLGRGNVVSVKGDQLVVSLEFKAKGDVGEAAIEFAQNSAIVDGKTNKDILSETKSGSYSLVGGQTQSYNWPLLVTIGGIVILVALGGWFLRRPRTKPPTAV
jgi:hypothetical protein